MAGRLYPSDRQAESLLETAIAGMLSGFAKVDATQNPGGPMTRQNAIRILTRRLLAMSRRGYAAAP